MAVNSHWTGLDWWTGLVTFLCELFFDKENWQQILKLSNLSSFVGMTFGLKVILFFPNQATTCHGFFVCKKRDVIS